MTDPSLDVPASVHYWGAGEGTIERVERCLLSHLMVNPNARLDCADLKPEDFSTHALRAIYRVVTEIRHPEAPLVARELEVKGIRCPQEFPSWVQPIAMLLDDGIWDSSATPYYVKAIKEAAVMRHMKEAMDV